MNTIKEMVKDNKKVFFLYIRNNEIWYRTECGFKFPVPISDIGEATLLPEDKAILFMRYINPHLKMINQVRESALKEANTAQSTADLYFSIAEKYDTRG